MTSIHDIRRYADLHERIPRFAEIAGELVVELGLEKTGGRGPKADPASDRVIRDYVRRRILSPTLKGQGSEERGYYGFQHLVEFLAARVLLNDGWPLEKIEERHRESSTAELLALIPGQPAENPAQALARSFQRGAADAPPRDFRRSLRPPAESAPQLDFAKGAPKDPTAASISASRWRAELPLLMRHVTGVGDPPTVRRVITIELGADLTLLVDQRRAQNLTVDEAEAIGRAVTAALIDFPNLARGKESK